MLKRTGSYGNLQHKQGVVQPDMCSPLDTGRTATAVVPYHQHDSLLKSMFNLLNSLVQQKSGAERCNRSAPKQKAEYMLHPVACLGTTQPTQLRGTLRSRGAPAERNFYRLELAFLWTGA